MPANYLAGALAGIGDRVHEQNLLDLQARANTNKLAFDHFMQEADSGRWHPEASKIFQEGAFNVLNNPHKDNSKVMADVWNKVYNMHQGVGDSGWMGGETQRDIPLQNMPISTQLEDRTQGATSAAAEPAPAPTPPPGLEGPQANAQPPAAGPGTGPVPPPMPTPGISAMSPDLSTTPPPQIGPRQETTPGGAGSVSAAMPAPPPGYTRSGLYTPEELAQMGGRAEYLKAVGKAQGELPAKMQELTFKQKVAELKVENEMAKQGFRLDYDINHENPRMVKMSDAEKSDYLKSIEAKNNAATTLAKARQTTADAEADYKKGLLDPKSPLNLEKLFRIDKERQMLSISQERLGMQQFGLHARYYGTDLDGNPLPGAIWDPDSGQYVGPAFQRYYAPTALTMSRGQAADPVIKMGNSLIQFANNPDNSDLFGKINGRWSDWEQSIGTSDPRKPYLKEAMESFAALVAASHGWKAIEAPQKFLEFMNQKADPKAFSGAVYSLIDAAQTIKEASRPNAGPGRGGGGKFSVTAGGQMFTFNSQKELDAFKATDAFKAKANIK